MMMQEHPMAGTMTPARAQPPVAAAYYQGNNYDYGAQQSPSQRPGPDAGVVCGPCQTGTIPGQYAPPAGPTQWGPPSPGGRAVAPSHAHMWESGAPSPTGGSRPMNSALGPMPGLLSSTRAQPGPVNSGAPAEYDSRPAAGGQAHREERGRGMGAYSGSAISGQLGAAPTGLAPQRSDNRRQARPMPLLPSKPIPEGQLPPPYAWQEGTTRNMDAVHSAQQGYTGAHHAKDGINSFEGMYGKRFAGWGTKSNVSLAHPPNQSSPNSEAKRVTAPWDTEQRPRAQGLGQFGEQTGKVDHLMNGHAGLTGAYPDPGKGRAVCNPGANGRRNIVIDSQGLTGTQDGSQRINPHAGKSSMGHLMTGPNGMVEAGVSQVSTTRVQVYGQNKVDSLGGFPQGIHQVGRPVYKPIQHAGKMTASNIVHDASGISMMARTKRDPVDHAPYGHGATQRWEGGVNDAYNHIQVQQATLARNQAAATQSPMW